MKRWMLLLLLLVAEPWDARCQTYDPCALATQTKMTFNATTAATAGTYELVPAVANKNIHLCGLYIVGTGGTSPTWQLEIGKKTSTACDTTATVVTQAMPASTAAPGTAQILGFGSQEILNTGQYKPGSGVSSSELCLVAGGTTPTLLVYGTYVQSLP